MDGGVISEALMDLRFEDGLNIAIDGRLDAVNLNKSTGNVEKTGVIVLGAGVGKH